MQRSEMIISKLPLPDDVSENTTNERKLQPPILGHFIPTIGTPDHRR